MMARILLVGEDAMQINAQGLLSELRDGSVTCSFGVHMEREAIPGMSGICKLAVHLPPRTVETSFFDFRKWRWACSNLGMPLLLLSRIEWADHDVSFVLHGCIARLTLPQLPHRILRAADRLLNNASKSLPSDWRIRSCDQQPERSADSHEHRAHILVVDDDAMVACVTAELLRVLDYDVGTVDSGQAALAYCRACPIPIDLVLLDMMMPDMDGTTCFTRLREIDPSVRVLISTGSDDDDHAVKELMQKGAIGVIRKPFDIHQLSHAVEYALGREATPYSWCVSSPSTKGTVN